MRKNWLSATTLFVLGLASGAQAQVPPPQNQPPQDQEPIPLRPGTMPVFGPMPVLNPDGTIAISLPLLSTQDSVRNRYRPDFDPLGLRVGSFLAFPSLTASAAYNSNVFNTPTGKKTDWAFELIPSLRLVSDFPRHALNLLVESRSLFYNRLDSENTTDFTADANGRIDVQSSTNITFDGGYQILHEARGAVDLPGNAAEPTEYSEGRALGMLNHAFNRVQVSAGGSWARFSFDPTDLTPPGPATQNNHDRDRDVYGLVMQGGLEFSPGYSAFVRGSYNDRVYDLKLDRNSLKRDSNGYEVDGGLQFELTRLLVGQVFAGFLQQDYDNASFADVSSAAFGGQFEWYPTLLTTIRANARRSVDETILFGTSSYTDTRIGAGVDHELLRNVILSADGTFERDDFNGTGRKDDVWGFSLGAAYRLNRNLEVDSSYSFTRRDSNAAGFSFPNNFFRVGLVGRL